MLVNYKTNHLDSYNFTKHKYANIYTELNVNFVKSCFSHSTDYQQTRNEVIHVLVLHDCWHDSPCCGTGMPVQMSPGLLLTHPAGAWTRPKLKCESAAKTNLGFRTCDHVGVYKACSRKPFLVTHLSALKGCCKQPLSLGISDEHINLV